MENKYKNCQIQEERDLVDQGYTICSGTDCGKPFLKESWHQWDENCSQYCASNWAN